MMATTSVDPKPTSKFIYRECALKNHQKFIQNCETDGCKEFKSDLGSSNALICLSCGCHRKFHRKILIHPGCLFDVSSLPSPPPPLNPIPPIIRSISCKEFRNLSEMEAAHRKKATSFTSQTTTVLFQSGSRDEDQVVRNAAETPINQVAKEIQIPKERRKNVNSSNIPPLPPLPPNPRPPKITSISGKEFRKLSEMAAADRKKVTSLLSQTTLVPFQGDRRDEDQTVRNDPKAPNENDPKATKEVETTTPNELHVLTQRAHTPNDQDQAAINEVNTLNLEHTEIDGVLVDVPITDLAATDGVLVDVPIEDQIRMKMVKSTPKMIHRKG